MIPPDSWKNSVAAKLGDLESLKTLRVEELMNFQSAQNSQVAVVGALAVNILPSAFAFLNLNQPSVPVGH
ncbi:hypothetical protein TNCV_609051 [Trichonephila clavipes]|nr:hypothetical protein TNCV_609051 [Trichonephila clavipes]